MERKAIGILIFPFVEVLDFCGPYEVFMATRLDEESRLIVPPPFDVYLVAEHKEPVAATGGLTVIPSCTIEDCPPLDILVVPGGAGTRVEIDNRLVIGWIIERAKEVETLTSVCTGSMLLGKAGLLDGHRATTHYRSLDWMRETFPEVTVEDTLRVVEDGDLITSAGISAGIDMALHVVSRYYGDKVARATARHMEYPFPEDNKRRI
jgi:transcriptional regulator GlxA family with amidase domain